VIYALLPAYNESQALPALLKRYVDLTPSLSEPLQVIVVDDGSKDMTVEAAWSFNDRLKIEVLKHGINKGLGAAFLTGFSYVAENGADTDFVVTMDAGNTHFPLYIPAMLARMGEADVVIASRYAPGGKETGVPLFRSILSRGASILYRILLGVPGARDYTCGYRMYRVGLIQKALKFYGEDFIQEWGFSSTGEILIKVAPFAKAVAEVPFELRYDLKAGESKMPKIKTVFRTLRLLKSLRHIARQVRKVQG